VVVSPILFSTVCNKRWRNGKEVKAMAEAKRIKEGFKEELTVREVTDFTREAIGLVKESYLMGLELSVFLWNENLKLLNSQIDNWFVLQQDYANFMKDFSQNFLGERIKMWNGGLKNPLGVQTDWYVSIQNNYLELLKNLSNKFAKNAVTLSQKNIETGFSVFDNFLNLFEGVEK
jgi:hypothetical protein